LLDIVDVTKRFRGLVAIDNLSIAVDESEIVGLIGPNGSGKTTLFNLITGVYKLDGGTIKFLDEKISGLSPHLIYKKGIARTYQLVRPFRGMSAFENVLTGALYSGKRRSMKDAETIATDSLKLVGLNQKADVPARDLTLYEMKRLELAKATASEPKLLLVDEFFAGLSPPEVVKGVDDIRELNTKMGMTLLIVEHNMRAITSIARRMIAISFGKLIAQGTPDEIMENPSVMEAYLGTKNVKVGS